MHAASGHYRFISESPFEWRFAGTPIVGRFYMLTGSELLIAYPAGKEIYSWSLAWPSPISIFVYAGSECFGESALLHKLALAFVT